MPHLLVQSPMNSVVLRPEREASTTVGFPYTFPFYLGTPGALYHTGNFDNTTFVKSRLPWQIPVSYAQKSQLYDPLSIQVSAPLESAISAAIYDCKGKLVKIVDQDSTTELPGNMAYGYPLKTLSYKFSFHTLNINPGRYFFVVSSIVGGTTKYYVSEPIDVKNNHYGTVFLEYSHPQNRYNTIFSINPGFGFRVEADLSVENWDYNDTSFTGQIDEPIITNSELDRKYDFILGTKTPTNIWGVPKWVIEKVANIFRCKTVTINGRKLTREPNTAPEIQREGRLPVYAATFKLLEQDKYRNGIIGELEARIEFPATYPFAISSVSMGFYLLSSNIIITGYSGIEAIRDYANTLGLGGEFRLDGSTLIYKNAANESYGTIDGVIRSKAFKFLIKKLGTNLWDGFSYKGSTIVVDFGRPGISGNIQSFFSVGNSVGIPAFYSGGDPTYTITLWHEETIEELVFNEGSIGAYYLYSLDDTSIFPAECVRLQILDQYEFPTLNAELFADYVPRNMKLKALQVRRSLLTSTPLFYEPNAIDFIDFRANAIDSGNFEDFTNNLVNQTIAINGTLAMEDQDPIAPATPDTLANIAQLTSLGWTCTTD